MPNNIDIIPGNFLALCASSLHSDNYMLIVWRAESLEPYWSFVGGTRSNSIMIEMLGGPPATNDSTLSPPPTDIIPISPSPLHQYLAHLSVHEHPLYPGLYTLWVSIPCSRPNPAAGSSSVSVYPVHVCKFRVSLCPTSQQCSIHPLYSTPLDLANMYYTVGLAGISFAGHTTSHWDPVLVGQPSRRNYLISLDPNSKSGDTLGGAPDLLHFPHLVIHVSPYSGTLWYVNEKEGAIIVEYYQ